MGGDRPLEVALHGARREVHEHLAGPDTFRDAIAALERARAEGRPTRVVTAITRSNARVLHELPRLLRARGVREWQLRWTRDDDDLPRRARLALAIPSALAALVEATKAGLDASIAGAPRCVLGPLARFAAPSPERAFAKRCAPCPSRVGCPGVDAAYLARFGPDELRPVDRVDASPRPVAPDIAASSLAAHRSG